MPRNALMHALQAGSNAVAGGVSAPVDGLAWLLRKAGVPVPQNALMGSQWMEDRGFTQPVPQGWAQVAGETLSGAAPMALAAKAPQVANALLRGGENLAARRTLNPQTGAVVWHGSPHKFDAFDSSKIGTGEGAQAYGHGLYLADNPEIAGHYSKVLPSRVDTPEFYAKPEISAKLSKGLSKDQADELGALGQEMMKIGNLPAQKMQRWRELHDQKQLFEESLNAVRPQSNLYKVDLPDEHIARMLDWDAPLSQQAPGVQKAIHKSQMMDESVFPHYTGETLYQGEMNARGPYKASGWPDSRAAVAVSEALRRAGVPGIRYLDGGSRAAGAGTRNYVVFPGEENMLRILERNGQQFGKP